jgi:AcrR family transcriptional regulator
VATRAGISKDDVVRTAAAIADAKGWDGLTLAAVAAKLRIRSPSLFNHVRGLEGLRRELKLLALRELGATLSRATIGKSRDASVAGLADAYRAFAKRHPGIYHATVAGAVRNDPELNTAMNAVVEICLSVVSGYGFDRREGIHAVRAMRSAVHGFATLESGGGFGLPLDVDQSFRWMVGALLKGFETRGAR